MGVSNFLRPEAELAEVEMILKPGGKTRRTESDAERSRSGTRSLKPLLGVKKPMGRDSQESTKLAMESDGDSEHIDERGCQEHYLY